MPTGASSVLLARCASMVWSAPVQPTPFRSLAPLSSLTACVCLDFLVPMLASVLSAWRTMCVQGATYKPSAPPTPSRPSRASIRPRVTATGGTKGLITPPVSRAPQTPGAGPVFSISAHPTPLPLLYPTTSRTVSAIQGSLDLTGRCAFHAALEPSIQMGVRPSACRVL
jgi:hypothetical protein